MRKFLLICLTLALVVPLTYSISFAGNGNNLPPGPRYMLNVIAFDNCPNGDFTNSNRHMIAVKASYSPNLTDINLDRTNIIKLTESQDNDFRVIDGNACNKGGAVFELPANPFECGTGIVNDPACTGEDLTFQVYKVFIRLVGKPQTGIDVRTCAIDPLLDPDAIVCSTENYVKVRETGKGKMVFDDVTRQLTTLCINTDLDPGCDKRVGIFDSDYYDYFWAWGTDGKAHAQVVFYPIPD